MCLVIRIRASRGGVVRVEGGLCYILGFLRSFGEVDAGLGGLCSGCLVVIGVIWRSRYLICALRLLFEIVLL